MVFLCKFALNNLFQPWKDYNRDVNTFYSEFHVYSHENTHTFELFISPILCVRLLCYYVGRRSIDFEHRNKNFQEHFPSSAHQSKNDPTPLHAAGMRSKIAAVWVKRKTKSFLQLRPGAWPWIALLKPTTKVLRAHIRVDARRLKKRSPLRARFIFLSPCQQEAISFSLTNFSPF